MALKRLPNDVTSLLCASTQVNSYQRAIEELVYNSLDAEATSIAIRMHIEESTIQVIDNGCGITKHDFNVLGQKHMTSKLVDLSTLKATLKTYGYRGEFLANIITVSQFVKITSRYQNTEETWAKTFHNGKQKKITKMTTRPTKGTTIDIKGFLYNQNIQQRKVDPINAKQNIKSLLKQLSLVRNNISLSLRDESKNEIIFKIHKNRDIYQTLSTLFDVGKVDVQELHVEKNEYKVKGLIGKTAKELDLHWIYLNGKFIHSSSKLHKVINEFLKKSLHIKDQRKLKKNNDEHQLFNKNIPFYFIFVSCPYLDYDITLTLKQPVIEFKNWEQINKLLEKLIKFYLGDINLKETKKSEDRLILKDPENINYNQDTRNQVKEIMNKILRSNSKKLGVSQLQNGVKGKKVKRKLKRTVLKTSFNITNQLLLSNNEANDNRTSSKRNLEIDSEYKTKKNADKLDIVKRQFNDKKEKINTKQEDRLKKRPHTKKNKPKDVKLQKNKKDMKVKNISATKNKCKASIKHNYMVYKNQKLKENNGQFKKIRGIGDSSDTDSVYKRSKIVAKKVEKFLCLNNNKRNSDNTFNTNIFIGKQYDNIIDNIPLPPMINKHVIDKYMINKLKTKSFKTTYDLIKTILISQQDRINTQKYNISRESYNEFPDFDYRRNKMLFRCLPKVPKRPMWTNKCIFNKYPNIGEQHTETSVYTNSPPKQYKSYGDEDNLSEYSNVYSKNVIHHFTYKMKNESNGNQDTISDTKHTLFCPSNGPFDSKLTYESHQYYRHEGYERNKNRKIRFITKRSRDNFITAIDFKKKYQNTSKSSKRLLFDMHMKQTDESYTIEYSINGHNNYNHTRAHTNISLHCIDVPKGNRNRPNDNHSNTYTIEPYNIPLTLNTGSQYQTKEKNNMTDELFNTYSIHHSNSEINKNSTPKRNMNDKVVPDKNNLNFVFLSKSQVSNIVTSLDNIEPLNICETVSHESGSVGREMAFSFNENNRLNDSLYNNFGNIDNISTGAVLQSLQISTNQDFLNITENISHHFSNGICGKQPSVMNNINGNLEGPKQNLDIEEMNRPEDTNNLNPEYNYDVDTIGYNIDYKNFHFKNRLQFVPKGMSQIFENCRSKSICDYNLNEDYFEDSIYNNFVNDVQMNTEIYQPIIQNVEDLTTKSIHKFQNKVKKDNASLVFDENSLKEAKVLGQVDCKFIAAIMKNRCEESKDTKDYLILFDQHAVHERIRLEKNLADYINEDRWKSIPLENIVLKISEDEILYLHNYKDKFVQLGLYWTILNSNEVTIHSIPEAILGKNPREVEKVIKAVKHLIAEEINITKLQNGCVSLYPKSIMDLVFSEACRYAVKFGDPLTKNGCIELLNALSDCKTPFQCAHGRPAMAVLMDIKSDKRVYKVNMAKLRRFKKAKHKC